MAQPLFTVIAASPSFLVAHRIEPVGLISFAALLLVGPPIALFLLVTIAGACHRQGRRMAMRLAVAGLTAAIWLPVLKQLGALNGWLILLLAGAIGIALGYLYVRHVAVRLFVSFLSPGLLLFPVLFLSDSSISKLLIPNEPTDEVSTVRSTAPVVVVVFDQLPLTSILDSQQHIDTGLFPHFAELAQTATWFRNATSVSDHTSYALPALLTGLYPRPLTLPTFGDHPRNLFEFLSPHYSMKVYEPITRLCRDDLCGRIKKGSRATFWALFLDLSIICYHVLAPTEFRHLAPPIDRSWRDFSGENLHSGGRWVGERDRDRRQGPLSFISSIRADDPQPTLYFLHCLLPHEPFRVLPSGTYYGYSQNVTGLLAGERWTNEPLAVELNYQRHLLQVRYVDRLLGKLLDRLRDVGLYERSLLVVTSDHGASFRPGDLFKEPTATNVAEIMSVPLIVKFPHQEVGEINYQNVEAVDVLPTIAEALGEQLPWPTDGRPAQEEPLEVHSHKVIFFDGARRSLRITLPELEAKYQSFRKHRLRNGDRDGALAYWSPVYPDLIERGVADMTRDDGARISARLHYPDLFQRVKLDSDFVPVLVSGYVEPPGRLPINVAVAINGRIWATTRTYGFRTEGREKGAWEVLVPKDVFMSGRNLMEVFEIRGGEEDPVLARIYSSIGQVPSRNNLVLEVARWSQGVESSGLYPQEWWGDRPARWTNGAATLLIPIDRVTPPKMLEVSLLHTGPQNVTLEILANGCQLLKSRLPPGERSLTVDLEPCALRGNHVRIDLVSDTFIPSEVDPKSVDQRRLGVALESLTWLD